MIQLHEQQRHQRTHLLPGFAIQLCSRNRSERCLPLLWIIEAIEKSQQSTLSGTTGPNDGHLGAGLDVLAFRGLVLHVIFLYINWSIIFGTYEAYEII